MKKILSIIALGLITVGLIACSLSETLKGNSEIANLSGILTEQKPDDEYMGTHLITDDSGNVTPLRSVKINLSNDSYLGNKVQVIGKMNETDKVFEVSGISVLQIVMQDQTKSELTEYQNVELGFKLKYYSDWTKAETATSVTFAAPKAIDSIDSDKVVISQIAYKFIPEVAAEPITTKDANGLDTVVAPDMSRDALLAYFSDNFPNIANVTSLIRKLGVDGLNTVKVDNGDDSTYFLYRNGFIYKIAFIASKTNFVVENKTSFNQMATEFRFIGFGADDSGNTGDALIEEPIDSQSSNEEINKKVEEVLLDVTNKKMISFDSLPYHFSAAYPSDWYYAGVKGTTGGVLHHYGFSDVAVENGNELIGLDVTTNAKPAGSAVSGLADAVSQTSGDKFTIFITVDKQNYKISGNVQYKDIIMAMAQSIRAITTNE